jgi:predicted Zn-dependent protease
MKKLFPFLIFLFVLSINCAGLPPEGIEGKGLNSAQTTYQFDNIPEKYKEPINNAISTWKKHIDIEFVYSKENSDITFRWKKIDDPKNQHGVTKFIFSKTYIYFDKEEPWDKYPKGAFLNVAIHELGHALGLNHSKKPESIMFVNPYVDVYSPKTSLSRHDIKKIQGMYKSASADK